MNEKQRKLVMLFFFILGILSVISFWFSEKWVGPPDYFKRDELKLYLGIIFIWIGVYFYLGVVKPKYKEKEKPSSPIASASNGRQPEIMLASTGQRLGTMFLDWIFLTLFFMATSGFRPLMREMNPTLHAIMWDLIYYLAQEALWGRTLGKLITGTKVVNEDGSKLTFGRALGRTLCRLIPFEALSFLGGSGRPRGWHDTIPKTKVISVRKIRQESSSNAIPANQGK